MIKRVNFTGRKRIPKSCVEIEVSDETPRTFNAFIDLSNTRMKPHSRVFIEAMCAGSSIINRYDFGTVETIVFPENRSLEGLEGENIFFTLKVVDKSERIGRILGIAENLRPNKAGKKTATGRKGILPIEEGLLGQELWSLEFGAQDVTLIVNSEVPGLKERARWDPLFYAIAYPSIIRLILSEAIDQGATPDDDDDLWYTLWLRFGKNLHPNQESPPSKEDGEEEWRDWIDEVIAAFSEEHSLKSKFMERLPSVDGEES